MILKKKKKRLVFFFKSDVSFTQNNFIWVLWVTKGLVWPITVMTWKYVRKILINTPIILMINLIEFLDGLRSVSTIFFCFFPLQFFGNLFSKSDLFFLHVQPLSLQRSVTNSHPYPQAHVLIMNWLSSVIDKLYK